MLLRPIIIIFVQNQLSSSIRSHLIYHHTEMLKKVAKRTLFRALGLPEGSENVNL